MKVVCGLLTLPLSHWRIKLNQATDDQPANTLNRERGFGNRFVPSRETEYSLRNSTVLFTGSRKHPPSRAGWFVFGNIGIGAELSESILRFQQLGIECGQQRVDSPFPITGNRVLTSKESILHFSFGFAQNDLSCISFTLQSTLLTKMSVIKNAEVVGY